MCLLQLANSNQTLNEASSSSQTKTLKIKDLEKNLAESEHERRLVGERLDAARSAAAEGKKQSHMLQEQLTHLQVCLY